MNYSLLIDNLFVPLQRNYGVKEMKTFNLSRSFVNEPHGIRTYIYDKEQYYVIVLEPLRKKDEYYLLTAYKLTGKDLKRNKILAKYNNRRLPELL